MLKNKLSLMALLATGLLCANAAQAQESATAAGGNASGGGGTVAYSIGQVVYTTNTGSNGSVAQGVQHPYEISVVLGVDNHQISLNVQAYPNPTTDYVILRIDNFKQNSLSYKIYNVEGKLLDYRNIENPETNIQMNTLASAAYFLKVLQKEEEVKTFKIIKN